MEHNEEPRPEEEARRDAPLENGAGPEGVPGEPDSKPKGAFEALYDKIPITYRQADILVKVLIGILALLLVIGVATGHGIGG